MKNAITMLAILIALVTSVSAIPILIDEVEFDDTKLSPSALNLFSVERGEEYEVTVRFTATDDVDNMIVRAGIEGFEFSDVEDIEDETSVFDVKENVTYSKSLNIRVPDDVDQDSYKLRITFSDRFSTELTENFNLQIDAQRNSISIDDVVFNPSDNVRAGSSLLTSVRLENRGEQDQQDVRVNVKIPELNVEGTEYIEEVENNEEEETEEIYLRIPRCAKPGDYEVSIEVEYLKRQRKVSEQKTITVLPDDSCDAGVPATTVSLTGSSPNVKPGDVATFLVNINNNGKSSKAYNLQVSSTDWAIVSVAPSSTVVVPAKSSQTMMVNVQVAEEAPQGTHSLVATIASGSESNDVTLATNVLQGTKSTGEVFEIVLVVLLVLLIIVGVVVGIMYLRNKDEPETYY